MKRRRVKPELERNRNTKRNTRWNAEKVKAAFLAEAQRLGRPPRITDFYVDCKARGVPTATTIHQFFSMGELLAFAGYAPNPTGRAALRLPVNASATPIPTPRLSRILPHCWTHGAAPGQLPAFRRRIERECWERRPEHCDRMREAAALFDQAMTAGAKGGRPKRLPPMIVQSRMAA